jgi:hypothetical protein
LGSPKSIVMLGGRANYRFGSKMLPDRACAAWRGSKRHPATERLTQALLRF